MVNGDEAKTLRDHWIPANQGQSAGVVQPTIQENNFELKPALINMVQQSRFGGQQLKTLMSTSLIFLSTVTH
jgi:hypothetical protein